jgi:hypothetical protein
MMRVRNEQRKRVKEGYLPEEELRVFGYSIATFLILLFLEQGFRLSLVLQ